MFLNLTSSLWSIALVLNLAVTGSGDFTPEVPTTDNIQDVIYSHDEPTEAQTLIVPTTVVSAPLERESYEVVAPPPPPPVVEEPVSVSKTDFSVPNITPDPGSAQAEALTQVQARGWGQDEFNCLVALWSKESGWRVNASNSSSGAYGIPQSLPGNKMASAGADWQTNPATQITWGLNYIAGRYATPCGAWAHSQSVNWY